MLIFNKVITLGDTWKCRAFVSFFILFNFLLAMLLFLKGVYRSDIHDSQIIYYLLMNGYIIQKFLGEYFLLFDRNTP